MEQTIHISKSAIRSDYNRICGHESKLSNLESIIRDSWDMGAPLVVTKAAPRIYTIKINEISSKDQIEFVTIAQSVPNVWIAGIYVRRIKRKIIGYAIVYSDAPIIKWFPAYLYIAYNTECKKIEPNIEYNDSYIRVLKFDKDFLVVCRKHVDAHYNTVLPDAATYIQFKGVWKDGA